MKGFYFYFCCSSNFFLLLFYQFLFCYCLIRFFLCHSPLLLNQLSILPVYGMNCNVDLHYRSLLLRTSSLLGWTCWSASTLAFSNEAQPARRVGDWLGGWEAVARKARSGPRAAGFSPSVKACVALLFARSIFLFCSVFFFFFSLGSCGGGKTYGAVYLFWSGVGSHMSLADFHTSMTVV